MSKERICSIKERAMSLLEMGMNQDISCIDAKEIGELMDIVKDCCETIKYDEEAKYYEKITEAMEKNSDGENEMNMRKYLPEYADTKYYNGMNQYARRRDSLGRYTYVEPDYRMDQLMGSYKPMYYTNNSTGRNSMRDMREGRAGMTRRSYMEMKEHGVDKESRMDELEKYLNDLGSDMAEMINGMDTTEKTVLKQKLNTLAEKMA